MSNSTSTSQTSTKHQPEKSAGTDEGAKPAVAKEKSPVSKAKKSSPTAPRVNLEVLRREAEESKKKVNILKVELKAALSEAISKSTLASEMGFVTAKADVDCKKRTSRKNSRNAETSKKALASSEKALEEAESEMKETKQSCEDMSDFLKKLP